MRGFYKALACVGMIVLSTAAALGVRHLAKVSKKRKEDHAHPHQDVQDIDLMDEEEAQNSNNSEKSDDVDEAHEDAVAEDVVEEVVTSETEIQPDVQQED